MSDSEKNHYPEEEYQLPGDEEYAAPETGPYAEEIVEEAAPAKSSQVSRLMQKYLSYLPKTRNGRILFAVVVVAIFGLIIHFGISNEKTVPTPAPKPVTVQPEPAVVSQPQSVVRADQALGSLDTIQAHASRVETQVQSLKTEQEDMKSAIVQMQSSNQQLEKALVALTDQMKMLTIKMNQMTARFSSSKQFGSEVVYHLRAVLPDRAWIVSNTGQTLTVTIGDQVDQYGVIQDIDPVQGVVNTSSGRKIYYGPNDF